MSHGVQKDSKSGARLVYALDSAGIQGEGFARVEVVDDEIEMSLLRYRPLGPRGCEVVLDFVNFTRP